MNVSLGHAEFTIGREFWTETGLWRCTDIGTRTICAIKLEGDKGDWLGPPYTVMEHVFDEYDFEALYESANDVPK